MNFDSFSVEALLEFAFENEHGSLLCTNVQILKCNWACYSSAMTTLNFKHSSTEEAFSPFLKKSCNCYFTDSIPSFSCRCCCFK